MAPGSAVLPHRFRSPRPRRPKRRGRSPGAYRAAIRRRGPYWRRRVGSCACAFSSVTFHGVRLLRERSRFVAVDVEAMKCLPTGGCLRRGLEFRRHLIEERQHQGDATISHQNDIYALDRLFTRPSIAPSQASAFVEQIDRPKLTENVVREVLMQRRDGTIELIGSVAFAVMIDEYAIFGPQLGDRRSSFLGVSLSEHFVKIAFDEGLDHIGHGSLASFS